MASRDGNGGGLGGFVWSYHGGDEGIMVLMCSTLLRLEPIGRLAQANSAPELHQARRGGRSLSNLLPGMSPARELAGNFQQLAVRAATKQALDVQY
uniref:Uncharacterized protein n=1 Tax=Oryza sativa subsp. japonica TaxID=39947 RepID=Q67V43_ORYSJ|nr:hypothetical protein [Oryza sativa Japonica Group]BAD37976.1 hypothetical protein [Oryza sativa Japonica Group]